MAANATALAKAQDALASGKQMSQTTAKSALEEAMSKLESAGKRASKAKEQVVAGAEALMHTGEIQGTVFLASMAEGYFGEDKMRVGSVDMRAIGGVAVAGWGIYEAMTGKGGTHQLAVGNGLLATAIGSYGRLAGAKLKEKKGDAPAAAAPAAPQLQGPLREIAMSGPVPEAELAGKRSARRNQFVPVAVL